MSSWELDRGPGATFPELVLQGKIVYHKRYIVPLRLLSFKILAE